MSDWTSEYLTLLDDCEKLEGRLTDWERGYIDYLRSYIDAGRRPTAKLVERLNKVWESATARG